MMRAEPTNHGTNIRVSGERRGSACVGVGLCLVLAAGCAGPVVDTPVETATELATRVTAPPPSEAGAADALAASPRHGEWVDIELGGSDRPIATWIVRPEGSADAPVVLVIHEIFGLTDWVRAVADRLAEHGFVAVVPDLLSGLGPDGGGTAAVASRDQVVRLIRSLEPADYHLVGAPVLGLYGGDDERVNATIPTAAREMARYGKHFESEIFPGAGHGFLRAREGRDGANREASLRAWPRTIEFLRRHTDG